MPHPRINANAVKGKYVRVASYPGLAQFRGKIGRKGWVKLDDITRATRISDAQGQGLQFVLKSQAQPFVLRGQTIGQVESQLRKQGVPQ